MLALGRCRSISGRTPAPLPFPQENHTGVTDLGWAPTNAGWQGALFSLQPNFLSFWLLYLFLFPSLPWVFRLTVPFPPRTAVLPATSRGSAAEAPASLVSRTRCPAPRREEKMPALTGGYTWGLLGAKQDYLQRAGSGSISQPGLPSALAQDSGGNICLRVSAFLTCIDYLRAATALQKLCRQDNSGLKLHYKLHKRSGVDFFTATKTSTPLLHLQFNVEKHWRTERKKDHQSLRPTHVRSPIRQCAGGTRGCPESPGQTPPPQSWSALSFGTCLLPNNKDPPYNSNPLAYKL